MVKVYNTLSPNKKTSRDRDIERNFALTGDI
jgi:hypothetical protein